MRRIVRLQLALLVALLLAAPLAARPARAEESGPAVLVKDLLTSTASSWPAQLTVLGGRLFFSADDGVHGSELWVSDGTGAGTALLKDIAPGADGSDPQALTPFGGALFLGAAQGLWRSDGTPAGTALVAPLQVKHMAVAGGKLFIAAADAVWVSDGTAAGTQRLVSGGAIDTPLAVVGAQVYTAVSGRTGTNNRYQLWRSDGTPAGTHMVEDFPTGTCEASQPDAPKPQIGCIGLPAPTNLTAFDGALVYALGGTLWRLDGNSSTQLFGQVQCCTMRLEELTVVGDKLFFVEQDAQGGSRLVVSDGTAAGTTHMPAAVPPYGELVAFNGQLVFAGGSASNTDGSNIELWRSNGTAAGTTVLKELAPGAAGAYPAALTVLGNRLYFTAKVPGSPRQVWVSDGSAAGTRLFTALSAEAATEQIVALDGRLFFAAGDELTANELWVSDGSAAGTRLVSDINANASHGSPSNFVALGERVYFYAYTNATGYTMMTSDGTPDGTQAVRDSAGAPASGYGLTPVGDRLFFFSNCAALWISEGDASARQVADSPPNEGRCHQTIEQVAVGERLFFQSYDQATGYALWVSDGTATGTRMVKDVLTAQDETPRWLSMVAFKGRAYFATDNDEGGSALWSSDGTAAGTIQVKALPQGAEPRGLTVVGNTLFFTLNGAPGQLWKSDGTAAGTALVRDIAPGAVPGEAVLYGFHDLGGRLVFIGEDPTNGYALWSSDGTPAGTRLLKAFGAENNSPRELVVSGALAYFTASTPAQGRELWASDGTVAGTRQVFESAPGSDARHIYSLIPFAGALVFGTEGADGYGLWRSDGTAAGTWQIQDLQLLEACCGSATPYAAQAGSRLFFTAHTPASGKELWGIALQQGVATSVGAPVQPRAAPSGTVDLPLRFLSQGTTTARGARLTLTLSGGVAYVSDTSGGTPQRSGDTVSWNMPAAGPLGGGAFSVRLRLPPAAPGTRIPLTLMLSAPGETTPADNTRTVTLLLDHQVFLPVIRR